MLPVYFGTSLTGALIEGLRLVLDPFLQQEECNKCPLFIG